MFLPTFQWSSREQRFNEMLPHEDRSERVPTPDRPVVFEKHGKGTIAQRQPVLACSKRRIMKSATRFDSTKIPISLRRATSEGSAESQF
jgi:hypothetical protein